MRLARSSARGRNCGLEGTVARAALIAATLAGCAEVVDTPPRQFSEKVVAGGSPERGRSLIEAGVFGCHACHRIEPIRKARGIVGPSLGNFGDRVYIAGTAPNRPGVLIGFLLNPPAYAPNTAMPVTGLTHDQARDIAAYLYTLRGEARDGAS